MRVITTTTMADFSTEPETNKCMDALWCCGPCVGITSLLVLIACVFAHVVYSIMALADISNTSIQDNCDSSNIWIFLLLTLILGSSSHVRTMKLLVEDNRKSCLVICSILIQLSFASWGAYEVWGVDCVNTSISVFTMSRIYVIFSYVMSALISVLTCIFIIAE